MGKNPTLKTSQGVIKILEEMFRTRPDHGLFTRGAPDEFSHTGSKKGNLYRLWWD